MAQVGKTARYLMHADVDDKRESVRKWGTVSYFAVPRMTAVEQL